MLQEATVSKQANAETSRSPSPKSASISGTLSYSSLDDWPPVFLDEVDLRSNSDYLQDHQDRILHRSAPSSASSSPAPELPSITTFADNFGWDPSLGLSHWWQIAGLLYRAGSYYMGAADYESAFVLLSQAATLLLVLLPSHPDFGAGSAGQQLAGKVVLDLLGSSTARVKPPLSCQGTFGSTSEGQYHVRAKDLTPWMTWNWKLKCRLVKKNDIIVSDDDKSVSFRVTFEDESGSIDGVAFNSVVDRLFFLLEEGEEYFISRGQVRYADSQGTATYELVIDKYTEIEEGSDNKKVDLKPTQFALGSRRFKSESSSVNPRGEGIWYRFDLIHTIFTDVPADVLDLGPQQSQNEHPEAIARCMFYSAWGSISVFNRDPFESVLAAGREVVQFVMGIIQIALDSFGSSPSIQQMKGPRNRYMALRRYLIKLSRTSGYIPASLFIRGVNDVELQSLSHGGYSDVFCAKWQTQKVALKRLRIFSSFDQHDTSDTIDAFYREAIVWRQLRHPNILPLLGIDDQTFQWYSPCMVSPLCSKGDVVTAMRDFEPQVALGIVDTWLLQIAKGLEYLHDQGIVHGDVRGGNIFVNDDLRIQLADFGLSTVDGSTTLTLGSHPGGTARWMAPELLKGDISRPNYMADVYSYGCTCIELYTRQRPFPKIALDVQVTFKVIYGARPERPDESSWKTMADELWKLVESCWGDERPSMSDINTESLEPQILLLCSVLSTSVYPCPILLHSYEQICPKRADPFDWRLIPGNLCAPSGLLVSASTYWNCHTSRHVADAESSLVQH
ncbi:unnamed protein product [Somion occarium]|uniref:Protein kinase domain-containing protein n=1 Tax=Somion occarium TaxID=3059160 RepID=A0ABP1E8F6_9APHY